MASSFQEERIVSYPLVLPPTSGLEWALCTRDMHIFLGGPNIGRRPKATHRFARLLLCLPSLPGSEPTNPLIQPPARNSSHNQPSSPHPLRKHAVLTKIGVLGSLSPESSRRRGSIHLQPACCKKPLPLLVSFRIPHCHGPQHRIPRDRYHPRGISP